MREAATVKRPRNEGGRRGGGGGGGGGEGVTGLAGGVSPGDPAAGAVVRSASAVAASVDAAVAPETPSPTSVVAARGDEDDAGDTVVRREPLGS
jgi:hypothetical protein